MASFDDGNPCTIETDSAGLRNSPTSSSVKTCIGGQTDNYLNYLSRMPMNLQIENTDAVIINAEEDIQQARSFQNQLLKTVLVTQNGQQIKPKVKLISEIPGSNYQEISDNILTAFEKTDNIFLFATKSLCDPNSILSQFQAKLILMKDRQKKNVIPVNTKNKISRDYDLGPMYSGVKSIEFWSRDPFFVQSIQTLLRMKIDDRLKRERELECERKKKYIELKEQESCGHLSLGMQRLELSENSGLHAQNQSLQNPGPRPHQVRHLNKESMPNSQIQIDGPTLPTAIPASHHFPQAHPLSMHLTPINQLGFSEIPRDHLLPQTLPLESSSQRPSHTQQNVSASSCLSHSQTPTFSSLEAHPSASYLPGSSLLANAQFAQAQKIYCLVPSVYTPHQNQVMASPYGQFQFDSSQFIRTPGARHSVQGDSQSQTSSTSKSTSQKKRQTTSDPSFQASPENSFPQSSPPPTTQSGIVQNITINIHQLGNAAIGSNPTFIKKTCDSSGEDDGIDHEGDSSSSDSLSNQEIKPGLDKDRSKKDKPIFRRSTGGNISTVDGITPPPSIRQSISSYMPVGGRHLSDSQEPHSQSDSESARVKCVTSQRYEDNRNITHETAVKQIFEEESESDEETNVKEMF